MAAAAFDELAPPLVDAFFVPAVEAFFAPVVDEAVFFVVVVDEAVAVFFGGMFCASLGELARGGRTTVR